jgi:hypothetical protein
MKKKHETVLQRDDQMTLGQMAEVGTILLQAIPWMTILEAQGIVSRKGIVIKKVRNVIMGLIKFTELGDLDHFETFFLEINYGLCLKRMISACKFTYIDDNVNEKNFSFSGEGVVQTDAVLLRFNEVITDEEALARLDKAGLRAGTLPELLAFVARYPKVLEKQGVTAPGSLHKEEDGDVTVPHVCQHGSPSRYLGRCSHAQGNFNGTFLAISK